MSRSIEVGTAVDEHRRRVEMALGACGEQRRFAVGVRFFDVRAAVKEQRATSTCPAQDAIYSGVQALLSVGLSTSAPLSSNSVVNPT